MLTSLLRNRGTSWSTANMPRASRALLILSVPIVCACASPRSPHLPKVTEGPEGTAPARRDAGRRPGPFDETFGLRAGGMIAAAFQTEASLAVQGGPSTTLDFESELGVADNASSARVDLYWRLDRKSRFDLGYFDLDRNGSRTASRQIQWGDLSFGVGATIESEIRTQVLPLRYTYYLVADDDLELGLSLGVYSMRLAASLSGLATLGNATVATTATETFETPVPLPVIGAQGGWAIADSLVATASAQVFYLQLKNIGSTDEIDGLLVDTMLGLDWRATENVGLGLAANWFLLSGGAERDRLEFDVDYSFAGIFAFLSMRI